MKNKILKISLLFISVILIIFGISKIVVGKVVAIEGKRGVQLSATNSTYGTLVLGENPTTYSYKLPTEKWEAIYEPDIYSEGVYPGYHIYCINPGRITDFSYDISLSSIQNSSYQNAHGCASSPYIGRKTPIIYEPEGEIQPLSVAAAYVVSDSPTSNDSNVKVNIDINQYESTYNKPFVPATPQEIRNVLLWRLRFINLDNNSNEGLDEGLIIDRNWKVGSHEVKVSEAINQEVKNYAIHDSKVRGKGLEPKDLTEIDGITTAVNQDTGKYTVGPFSVSYTEGIYGDIAFAGISNITVCGYNSNKELVRDDIKVEKIVLKDSMLGFFNAKEQTPEYFEPSEDLKVDESKQVYPRSGQGFKVVFDNPNEGLSYEDENRISYISIKVKFKYMLANGEYIKLKGSKYVIQASDYKHTHTNSHSHSGSSCYSCKITLNLNRAVDPQQYAMGADAIRSVYEQEIEIGKQGDNYINISMALGGNVWEDVKAGKESALDGIKAGEEPAVVGIPVILYTEDGKKQTSTITNEAGEYSFENVDSMNRYYVEFQYNGQQYENTIYTNNLSGGYSNATESVKDRDAFNAKFEKVNGDEGYSKNNIDTYLPNSPFGISAYTGSNGKESLQLYPKYSKFVISEYDLLINGEKHEAIYEQSDSQREVDFGITRRIEFDMAVNKDVYAATVKINGKTEVYGYDKKNLGSNDKTAGDTWNIQVVGGYNRGISNDDYNFTGQNGNKDELLEVYVTYKIAVRNQSQSMLGHVTKLYDYYDSTYEYKPELSWMSNTNYMATNEESLKDIRDAIIAENVSDKFGEKVSALDSNGKLTIDVGKKQSTGETVYLYLTFKVKGEGPNLSLGIKGNSVEIGEFTTYYKAGTILPHYGENNYKVPNDNIIAGRVDRDSIPSSMGQNGQPNKDEDDENAAPGLNVALTGEGRKLNGTVWEDKRTEKSGEVIIGNGYRDNKEIGIAGVTVQLVEKTVEGKEYVWKETKTDTTGNYNFEGYIPGDYVVRFLYGDSIDTVATSANGGKNIVSYNGQDYKSTIYQKDIVQQGKTDLGNKYDAYTDANTQNETGRYGYDIEKAEGKNISDAKDIWSRRESVINYSNTDVVNSKAEILASPYSGDNALMQELIKNTYMTAETGVIVVEVEKNMQTNLENGMPNYDLKDIDLGLVERPKAQLEIDKSISNVKVTLANGSVLFDVNKSGDNVIWKTHEAYNLAEHKDSDGKYENYYGQANKNRYSFRDASNYPINTKDKGLIQITMDEELMHGATIQISYKVKVTNVGEVDYEEKEFYYKGTNGSKIVTTRANQVVDYVANNLKYDANNEANKGWDIVKGDKLLTDGLVNNRLSDNLGKVNTILQTEALNKELKPGESSEEKTLVLTQLISTENTSDDLTYSNMVEIVKTSNTVGRRMAYSVVGNQDPQASEASEVDSSLSERVVILSPFGDTHILYILGVVIGIILTIGIALIIKKTLKK